MDSMRERLEKKCNLFYLVCEDICISLTAYMKGMVNKGITMKSYIKSEKFYGIILPPFPPEPSGSLKTNIKSEALV